MTLLYSDPIFLTRAVCDVADLYAQGRIVSVLEGGYNTHALADSVATHVETLFNYPEDYSRFRSALCRQP